jgi:hypothetical protein
MNEKSNFLTEKGETQDNTSHRAVHENNEVLETKSSTN